MSEIDRIVSGTITADTVTTPREGFGVQAVCAYHTKNLDLFRDYESAADVLADGFTTSDPAYRMVARAKAQNPSPKVVRLVRMTTAVAHTVKLTVKETADGKTVSALITKPDGTEHTVSHTLAGAEGAAGAATALATAITALTGITATAVGAVITCTVTAAGDVWYYDSFIGIDYLDQTPNASIDADLAAVLDVADDFYYVTIALGSKANIDAVMAWCEAQSPRKFFGALTSDSVEAQTGNSVVGAEIKSQKLTHTLPTFHTKQKQYLTTGWIGLMSAKDPGSATFALKQVAGVDADKLTATQKNALDAAGLNYYVAGSSTRNVTRKDGTVGSGEKADIIVGTDWLASEIKASVFDDLAKKDKVGFDDAGIAEVEGIIYGCLDLGVERNFLEPGNGDDIPAPYVKPMKVSDVDATDRANRKLTGVQWSARLKGAIHAVEYAGNLTV